MKRRAAIEPVIGHLKAEHRMGRNHLKAEKATASTPFWQWSGTTSRFCCDGWRRFCVLLSCCWSDMVDRLNGPNTTQPTILHG
jgi:hypothetical protein